MNPPTESILDLRARLQLEIGQRHEQLAAMENAVHWERWLAGMKLVATEGGWLDVTHLDDHYLRANIETKGLSGHGDDHPYQKHFGLEGYHDAYSTETCPDNMLDASISHNDGMLDIRVGFKVNYPDRPPGIVTLKRLLAEIGVPIRTDYLKAELANLQRQSGAKAAEIVAVNEAVP